MKDNFDDNIENDSEEISNKDKFNNVLGYIPFLNIWMLFAEKSNESELTKMFHRQGIALFLLYIVFFVLFSAFSIYIGVSISIIYFFVILFFATKAYNGIYVEVNFIEWLIESFTKKSEKK